MRLLFAASLTAVVASFCCSVGVTAAYSQTTDNVTLFRDTFNAGKADNWTMQDGWAVERDEGNFVLSGSGNTMVQLKTGGHWGDYSLRLRMRILRRGVNLWFRWSAAGAYVVSIGEEGVTSGKQAPLGKAFYDLANQSGRCELGAWHDVEIRVVGDNFKYYLDGDLRLDHTDDRPLKRGTIALQTPFDDCQVHIDDVVVVSASPASDAVASKQQQAPIRRVHSQPSAPHRPEREWVTLFRDDFDTGTADDWKLDEGWSVRTESRNLRNFILSGSGSARAKLRIGMGEDWTDYRLTFKMKILRGGVNLNYRVRRMRNERLGGRYYLGFNQHGADLRKEAPWGNHREGPKHFGRCELGTWHDLKICVVGGNTKFYVNGDLWLDISDPQPLEQGSIAFDTLENSHVYFDDVLVVGAPPLHGLNWVKVGGPMGGLGYDVRIDPVDPSVMYVTDNFAGVAKSTDGGNTWREMNEGITARLGPSGDMIPAFCLTIDPKDRNVVWAGTSGGGGIFKSTDAGKTWARMDNGIIEPDKTTLRSFTVDPRNSNIVYCGTEIDYGEHGLENQKTKGRIYKTQDGGRGWSEVWYGDALVRHIIIDPTDSNIVYAATGIFDREAHNSDVRNGVLGGVGILKSTDGGRTWTEVNNGLDNLYVGYLTMHPEERETLYAATGNYATARKDKKSGLFVTHDGARSWSRVVLEEDYFPFTAVRFSRSNPRIIYAGTEEWIWRSDDGGATWQQFGKGDKTYGPPGVRAGIPIDLTIDPRNPHHIFANNYLGGVIQSHDGGETWRDSSNGYSGADLRNLAISPFDHNDVYVVGRTGPFRSSDGGRTWMGIRGEPWEMYEVVDFYAIESAPDNPENVIATSEGRAIIYRSTNGGRNWTEVWRHPGNLGDVGQRHGFKALRFAPSDPNTVYAGMCFRRVLVDYAGSNDSSYGVYVSRDGGSTNNWRERNNGFKGSRNIHDIAVHPTDPGVAYAATNDEGVFKTTDYGKTWTQVIQGFGHRPPDLSVRALALDPRNPSRIYAGVENGGIYVTVDAGSTWSNITAGMDQTASIHSIAINPANPKIVVAGDWRSGVYYTNTGREPWTPANQGLSMRAVTSLLFSHDGAVLYAATEGGGVFKAYSDSFRTDHERK